MDPQRLELVRTAYQAWNEAGLGGLEPALSEAVELHDPGQMPDSGVWRGRDAVLERLDEVAGAVGGGRVEFERFIELGDEVLVAMRWQLDSGEGRTELGRVYHLVRVTGERISRMRVYLDETQAVEAASRGPEFG